jgi:uncharacterized lipoprotein
MTEWVFRATEESQGILTVSMYEIGDVPHGDRKAVRVELDLSEVIGLQDAVNKVIAYHLRIMR